MSDTQDVEALVASESGIHSPLNACCHRETCRTLARERDEAREATDSAYHERNQVVGLLAKFAMVHGCRVGFAKTAIEGWDEEWHGCVYIDLPTGQVSWHYHDSDMWLFNGLPAYDGAWDGHSTPEKYARVNACYPIRPTAAESRASSLEAQLAGAKEGLERVRDECQCTIDLYDRHGPSFTSPAGDQYEPTSFVIDKMGNLFAIAAEALASAPASAGVGVKMPDDARIRELMKGVGFEHMHHPGGKS